MKSHKQRNKLTSIIFALSLGCIMFLLTAANLQVKIIQAAAYTSGADLEVRGYDCAIWSEKQDTCLYANDTDPVLVKWKDHIKDFAYTTFSLTYEVKPGSYIFAYDTGQLSFRGFTIQGIQPSTLMDESFTFEYLDDFYSSLSPSKQLYTPRGSQGFGVSDSLMQRLGVNPYNYSDVYLTQLARGGDNDMYWMERALYTLKKRPDWAWGGDIAQTSMPMASFYTQIRSI